MVTVNCCNGLQLERSALSTTKKVSLEVAPTTLWLVLLIYRFQCKSVFLARSRNWFTQF